MHWAARRLFPKAALEFYGDPEHVLADYLIRDYDADTDGRNVVGFVHIEAQWLGKGPTGPVAETRWLESLGMSKLKGIVGHADLGLGAVVDDVLAAHVDASPRFRGVRYLLYHHPDKRLLSDASQAEISRDETWRLGYASLAKHGLSFETVVYDHQLPELADLARDFPETPVILCHLGTPVGVGGEFAGHGQTPEERERIAQRWREGMSRLAEQSNVYVKLSGVMPCLGLGYHQDDPPTAERVAEEIAPLIDFAVDTFGAERCMFGSNFPVDKVSMPWSTLYGAFERTVAARSSDERRALFHDTAARAYRLSM